MKTLLSSLTLASLVVPGLSGCDTGDGSSFEPTEIDEAETMREHEILDIVTLDGGLTVEFGRTEDGAIVLVEDVPVGELSPTDTLMDGQNATPLELYLAIAPVDQEPPEALVAAHRQHAVEHGGDVEPRELVFDPGAETFRTTGSWDYVADCDRPDDQAWFDQAWQAWGWSVHDYRRTNDYTEYTQSTGLTDQMRAHMCSDGPSGKKWFKVKRSCTTGPWSYVYNAVVKSEHRNIYRVWNESPNCAYRAYAANYNGAKPTYSLAISAP